MKIMKILYWIVLQSRWLQLWSILYQLVHNERKFKKSSILTKYTDPIALQTELDKIEYSKDTWKQLWDVCHNPYYLKHILDEVTNKNDQPGQSFDCTSYAILAANLLDPNYNPILLGIFYKKKNKFKFKGHMVCVFETPYGFRHMGNWGLSPVFKSLKLIAKDIAAQVNSELIGYTTFDKGLGIIRVYI